MNSEVVATLREALESRRRHTAELESINDYFNGAGYTRDEIARIDAALHALDEAAGWEMLPDGEYMLTKGNDEYAIGVSNGGADVSWEKNGYYHRAQEMEFPDELRLFRKRQPARQGVT